MKPNLGGWTFSSDNFHIFSAISFQVYRILSPNTFNLKAYNDFIILRKYLFLFKKTLSFYKSRHFADDTICQR